ncbi:conserved hypothetical protein [Leishmania braziliensis MHOM/BR/75/M2904]|uniref:Uncharacterized protein n=2 Tax=Leishmania braziliensis TaxID=5660 RepID=A4HKR1_LEIBR|nr:conserved hypothetical protein [Leishmania braziliensis MHOM/BR/75/M2904]CAJ2478772.1 unnamed protein product [Leishmania braziliensis]CAM43089.2 conserved hypothetical protein [Leishmania braziliensis MHOM/BR/75/M2904]
MQAQVRLHRLLRRACTPGVLSSNQVGVTVHALRQLNLLDVSSHSPERSILPIVRHLCSGADARSQANLLHALASAVSESHSCRTVVHQELHSTVQLVQAALLEVADTLTATETVLVMEALLKLMPYVGCDAGTPLVNSRLVEEVRERTMALASVVERPVDLLGVTRVVVEATSSTSAVARDGVYGGRPSVSNFAWASFSLEHILRVVQARLSTFSKQELISLVDVLTVRRSSVSSGDVSFPSAFSSSAPSTPFHHEKSRGAAASMEKHAETAADTTSATADGVMLLDASRPLIPDILACALTTVPSLSISQLCAWLTRLTTLRLTDNSLLLAVVQSLASADVQYFTIPQLASGAGALANLLTLTSVPGQPWAHAELCIRLYARLLHCLSSALYDADRHDPEVVHHAQTRLLPLLGTIPEAALDDYLDSAMPKSMRRVDLGFGDKSKAAAPDTAVRPHFLSVCATLASAIEKTAAVLLRSIAVLPPREQALVASAVFYWRVYTPSVADMPGASTAAVAQQPSIPFEQECQFSLKCRDVLHRCSPLTLDDMARKHRALCGLIITCSAGFTARDSVYVLNELVVAHYTDRALQVLHQEEQQQQQQPQHQRRLSSSAADLSSAPCTQPSLLVSVVRVTSEERQVLMKLLNDQLQGPLLSALGEVHTSQLVRYLSSLSRMGVGAKGPYRAVMRHLNGRSLSSFEQVSLMVVMARHHLRSRRVVHEVIRALPELGTALSTAAKVTLLKSLGQVNGQQFVKAPYDETLLPGKFFPTLEELPRLTFLQLVFCFNGLMELRQYENPAAQAVLVEISKRLCTPPLRPSDSLRTINSATALAEFLASLCRFGGPAEGVSTALLLETLQALEQRLATTRSLFVDLARLNWYWPCVQEYFHLSSALWNGCASSRHGARRDTTAPIVEQWSFTTDEWLRLTRAFGQLVETAGARVAARLQDIAKSPSLRPNTFLWCQMVCGLRFGGIPPRGSAEEVRLVENLEQKKMLPLLSNPQQLLDMTVLALHFTSEGRDAEAMPALRFIQKNMAAMQVQDCLQVWWYISQLLSVSSLSTTATSLGWVTSPRRSEVGKVQGTGTNFSSAVVAPVSERARFVLQEVRDAAKEQVLRGEKAVTQKLSVMEKRLLKSLQ